MGPQSGGLQFHPTSGQFRLLFLSPILFLNKIREVRPNFFAWQCWGMVRGAFFALSRFSFCPEAPRSYNLRIKYIGIRKRIDKKRTITILKRENSKKPCGLTGMYKKRAIMGKGKECTKRER